MGPNAVGRYCENRPEIAALLVGPAEREGDICLFPFNLHEGQWQQLAER
jgi:hypothetical protein